MCKGIALALVPGVQLARTAFFLVVVAVASAVMLRTTSGQSAATGRFGLQAVKETHLEEFSEEQLALLEMLNRTDRDHLRRLGSIVVPRAWSADDLVYSPFPARYESASAVPKALIVLIELQAFGAYEHGALVRWGPVSTGARGRETTPGRLSLNWKSTGRSSTVNPDWYMPWYFNIRNAEGVAFHAYALPGRPASHGCIRLLERDAVWLFSWGEEWRLEKGRVRAPGTPVLIAGQYDFDVPPPWTDVATLGRGVALPEFPFNED